MNVPNLISRLLPEPGRALERRLHKKAVAYWRGKRGDRAVVALADFRPEDIEDDSRHGFLLDLRKLADPVFAYIGPVLEQEAGVEGQGTRFMDVPLGSLLMCFASNYHRVLASGAPETAEYDFVTDAGYHVLCRGALLPLSSDGEAVDHVYGVISWKSEKAAIGMKSAHKRSI